MRIPIKLWKEITAVSDFVSHLVRLYFLEKLPMDASWTRGCVFLICILEQNHKVRFNPWGDAVLACVRVSMLVVSQKAYLTNQCAGFLGWPQCFHNFVEQLCRTRPLDYSNSPKNQNVIRIEHLKGLRLRQLSQA